jgi:precorrin-3B synthase
MSAAPQIKGWCPGALRPMESGDGLLLRAKTVRPRLSAREAAEIASIARDCGNGLVDLTQRAQLQLRGATEASLPEAQRRLRGLGLLAKDAATESAINVLVSPLAGLTPSAIDAGALAERLAQEIAKDAALLRLPGKFGFLVDDGGSPGLAASAMDIRLEALDAGVAVVADGARERAFIVAEADAVATALALARAFLALREGRELELRRMRALVAALGLEALAREAGLAPAPYRSMCDDAPPREIFGVRPLPGPPPPAAGEGDGLPITAAAFPLSRERSERGRAGEGAFVGIGAPSGRLGADDLAALGELAETHGLGELRLTPWRALLLPCPCADSARAIVVAAARRGLIVEASDPRLSVVACPGAPDCPQARGETRAHVARLAPLAARLAFGGVALHISGCAKGCAMPATAKVALVARAGGFFDLVENGRADEAPSLFGLDIDAAERALAAQMEREPR